MKLSKLESDWINGNGPRPYSLSTTGRNDRLDMNDIKYALRQKAKGKSTTQIAKDFRQAGKQVSITQIKTRMISYERKGISWEDL